MFRAISSIDRGSLNRGTSPGLHMICGTSPGLADKSPCGIFCCIQWHAKRSVGS